MDGSLSSSESARPGTEFYAPQVRLVTPQGQPLLLGGQPVSQDIMTVTATLPANGIGQVEIKLNNQRHDEHDRPVVPIWRYNKLDPVSFGTRLRVDFRYGSEGWAPMILARITDLDFVYPSAAGAHITLKGEDLLSLLKVKPQADTPYDESHEIDIVEAVLQASGTDLRLPTDRPQPLFTTPLESITHQKSKSYVEFITDFAKRMDYEVFVAFDDPEPGPAGASASQADARTFKFHFEPARSAILGDTVTLQWGRDIIDFKPKFAAWDLPTGATARGSVPRGRGTIDVSVTLEDAINDLHTAEGGTAPLSAARARATAFDDENRPPDNIADVSVSNINEERARMAATAKLRSEARKFLTADITTIGFTRLRPSIHVNLTGFYPPFDGIYYVHKTVHSLSAAGYITKISLRRPGMLDPSGYPGD